MVPAAIAGTTAAGLYEPVDIVLTSTRTYANPFLDVRVSARLVSPSGKAKVIGGVYDGAGKWLVRASFDELGEWKVSVSSEPDDPSLRSERLIQVAPSGRPGPVRIEPVHLGFVHADGSPFFHSGDTSYSLIGLDRETQRLPYLKLRRAQGFSHIRFMAFHADDRYTNLWPWGGTAEAPDPDRFNPAYFAHLDALINDLRAHGLYAEIILENFYPGWGFMTKPSIWTAEREKAWLYYVVSRYAAFDNVLYWTLANEFESHPEGRYRLDKPGDIDWARTTAAFVKSVDPYRHPVTVHPFSPLSVQVEMFGDAPEIDVLMVQEHGEGIKVAPNVRDGSGAGLEEKIRSAREKRKPVVDGEFGYEFDGVVKAGSNVTSDLLRRHAWRIVMGGGHISSGFRSTVYNFRESRFDITNGGRPAAGYIEALNKFFRERTRFGSLDPRPDLTRSPNLCLRGGDEYVLYAPAGGEVVVDLSGDKRSFVAEWLNPVTGKYQPAATVQGGKPQTLVSPWGEAVLHLRVPVRVSSPRDGGWPRSAARISENGPNDFTVDPDGHKRYVMVEVENAGPRTERVTLRGFLTDFGKLRNRQTSTDQYLYVKPPNGAWRRVYRQGTDTAFPYSPLVIDAPPGRTQVSTVVSFTYSEYLQYVESLNDPRVKKEVILTSGGGAYKVYRIRITTGDRPNKLRIALCRTNHAYERSGFFMAQGAIDWLLSGDPAANLDHIEWTIYPVLDPQAIRDGQDYTEYNSLALDDGRKQHDALWHAETGELPAQRYHVLTDVHMWEVRDYESYKYNDPFAPSGPEGNGRSEVEKAMLAFWPYWYEFGIDQYDHENKWRAQNSLPEHYGGALVTHLEIPFYGKDDIDPRERLREQGRLWARSHSQAYLRMQLDRGYWGASVDTSGARFLPLPRSTLLESLSPSAGLARSRTSAAGSPMRLQKEEYGHGIGMRAGDSAKYRVPDCAASFRAMVGMDDADRSSGPLHFSVGINGRERWRSRPLSSGEREMAFLPVTANAQLTLTVHGPKGALANWGGAKFTCDDPESQSR
jgi:hypothetical protein